MKILDVVQGTPEWMAARAGVPTASEFDRLITMKGEPSKQREKYLFQLAGERITKKKEDSYQNGVMLRGKELEAEARACYKLITDKEVKEVGFCISDNGLWGCSPDGLIGEEGGLELKCPTLAVHVGYLLAGTLPSDYYQQCQGSLFVTGRKWWSFMSYYPGIKPLIIKVTPDKAFHTALKAALEKFCTELDEITERIR